MSAGVHSATLIKRFGSRHGVLSALSRRWIAAIPAGPTASGGRTELWEWAASVSHAGTSSAQMLSRIGMLHEDLADEELRGLLHQGWQKQIRYLQSLIEGACKSGQLPGVVDPETAASLLLDVAHGCILRAAAAPDPANVNPKTAVQQLLKGWE